MNSLRWVLAAIGLLIILLIYFVGKRRSDKARLAELADDIHYDPALLDSIARNRDHENPEDLGSAVEELGSALSEHRTQAEIGEDELASLTASRDEEPVSLGIDESIPASSDDPGSIYQVERSVKAADEELIIVLNVMAQPGQAFERASLLDAFEATGMQYGDMQIFHHYGIDDSPSGKAVFSVANILEPGIFDLSEDGDFSSPGLCLFMRLPGMLDGRVAFELMLNTGRRLADLLDGELRDDARNMVGPQTVAVLREKIADFARTQADPEPA